MSADPTAAASGPLPAPLPNTHFDVGFDGLPPLSFSSVEGIESAFVVLPYATPRDRPPAPHRSEPTTLLLRRGATGGLELWNWYAAARQGDDARRDGLVTIRDAAGHPALRVALRNARPTRWRLGRLDALQPGVLIEELELSVETIDLL